MAYIKEQKNKDDVVTSIRVRWRLGGARDGEGCSERFTPDEEGRKAAEVFCKAVNDAGQQWPPGWVKGKGYVDPAASEPDEERFRFRNFAAASVDNRTGIEEHYRQACHRDLTRWIYPTFGECDVRSTEHFSSATVRAWVRTLEQTWVHKGQMPKKGEPKRRKMSPKTIRNLHGLLSSVLEEAVKAEPPLRERNPCELTNLPRADDDGADGGEDIEFLTPDEVEGIISCMGLRADQLLAKVKYGTGMRWSEVTALAPECLIDWQTAKPVIRVKRAWKRDGNGGYYLGTPKSRRGRRSVRVSSVVVEAIEELGGQNHERPDRLFFTGGQGQRLHYSTFYDRWQRAVGLAKAKGLLPRHKRPTPHDLRHSHAAVLISEGRGLTYVQRRLGHESIKTTSDTYGHLLPEADDDAMEAIDRSLGRRAAAVEEPVLDAADRSRVYVVHLPGHGGVGERAVPFWTAGVAHAVAEQWGVDHPGACGGTRVETLTADWWRRQQTDGLKGVREGLPGRRRLWWGSARYLPDGSVYSDTPGPLVERWVWEWEAEYEATSAVSRVRHLPGRGQLTEALAYGADRAEVAAEFERARLDALARCGSHPEEPGVRLQESGQIDS